MITFIDTNVLIYLIDDREPLHGWSEKQFIHCKSQGPVVIPDVVYAEFSAGMTSKKHTDEALETLSLERAQISRDALYEAGRLFRTYKTNGGNKKNVLSDFFIAAQAADEEAYVLTANRKDFYKLLPTLKLITPKTKTSSKAP